MDERTMRTAVVGSPVVTRDGHQIGTVKEVRIDRIKLNMAMQPDFWLPIDIVSSEGAGITRLAITSEQIGKYKVDAPDEMDRRAGHMSD